MLRIMVDSPAKLDRRHLRRDETVREIVAVAVSVMGEQGAGGLSLGEVARRMGMRTPSLYTYFASKNALYDEVFADGWRRLLAALREQRPAIEAHEDVGDLLLAAAWAYVRWSVEHPAHTQLMAWRPVPGWAPSTDAYAVAVETWVESLDLVDRLRGDGRLTSELPAEHLLAAWTVLLNGVLSQQLANAPHEPVDTGRYTSLLPELVAMYVQHYVPAPQKTRASRGRRTP